MIKAIQNLTTSQQLLIAVGFVGLCTTLASIWLPPEIVAKVGGAFITFLGVLGTALTGQGSQLTEVSKFPGIEPIQTNAQANAAVKAVAESDSAPKVLPPK